MYTLQAPKKSYGCTTVLAVIGGLTLFVIGAIFLMGFVAAVGRSSSYASSHASTQHHVVYKVTTSRDWDECYYFDVTYEMPSGTSQNSAAICDGKTSAVIDQRSADLGDFVYLSVQNDEQSANIGCQIWIDGSLVYETHSQGQYVIASCSGSVDRTNVNDNFQPAPVPTPRPSYAAKAISGWPIYRRPDISSSASIVTDESIRVVALSADHKWVQLDNGYWIHRSAIVSAFPALPVTD